MGNAKGGDKALGQSMGDCVARVLWRLWDCGETVSASEACLCGGVHGAWLGVLLMVHATGGFFSLMVAKEQVICSGGGRRSGHAFGDR